MPRVYRPALEQGMTESVYHAVADEAVPFKAIAEVIGLLIGLQFVVALASRLCAGNLADQRGARRGAVRIPRCRPAAHRA